MPHALPSVNRRPPGPPQRWFSGSFPDFRRDMLGFMQHLRREYGDVVAFRLGRRRCILVNRPEWIEAVLVKHHKNFIKHFAIQYARPVLGNGLLSSEDETWLRHRRLIAAAFHHDRIQSYAPDMVASTMRMLGGWQDGQTRDVHADMMHLTLDIVAKTLFGAEVGPESHDVDVALRSALDGFASKLDGTIPLPAWIPTPRNLRFHRAIRGLDRVIQHMIDARRGDSLERNDLLSILLHARHDDDATGMTDRQLRDEARTFLLAGHETTALSLSWSFFLLATHPHAQARLREELDQVLGDRLPGPADLPQLRYAEQVVLEAMRLYPPAFVIGREARGEFELGGYRIPEGTTVFMSPWVTHRDARFHPHPEQFEPERWTGEHMASLPKMAYFPFGGGPRVCIGNNFAIMEGVLLLSTVVQRWSMQLVADHPIQLAPLFTLRPKHGIKLIVSRRAPHDDVAPAPSNFGRTTPVETIN